MIYTTYSFRKFTRNENKLRNATGEFKVENGYNSIIIDEAQNLFPKNQEDEELKKARVQY